MNLIENIKIGNFRLVFSRLNLKWFFYNKNDDDFAFFIGFQKISFKL